MILSTSARIGSFYLIISIYII